MTVAIYVQPRASRTEIVGRHGQAIKIRVAAPAADGEANAELVRFLARQLGVATSAVTIMSGAAGRTKHITVTALDDAAVRSLLLSELPLS